MDLGRWNTWQPTARQPTAKRRDRYVADLNVCFYPWPRHTSFAG